MNPLVIIILVLSALSAGSVGVAHWQIKQNGVLQTELKNANAEIKRANELQEKWERASHDNQDRITVLNRKLAAVRMQRPVCVIAEGAAVRRPDGSPEPSQLVGSLGISSAWIDELIAEGERYRSQVIGLQDGCQ